MSLRVSILIIVTLQIIYITRHIVLLGSWNGRLDNNN